MGLFDWLFGKKLENKEVDKVSDRIRRWELETMGWTEEEKFQKAYWRSDPRLFPGVKEE